MAFYLFPGVMYQRSRESFRETSYSLKEDYRIYELACKQYLGFGFLFQFIPGTQANKARQQFSNNLGPEIEEYSSKILDNDKLGILRKFGTYSRLYSYLNVAPLFRFITQVVNGFRLGEIIPGRPFQLQGPHPYSDLNNYSLTWLVLNFYNPLIVIYKALEWMHSGINALAGRCSTLPKILLKGVASLVLGVLKAPVIAAQDLLVLTKVLIETLIISPLVHVGASINETFFNPNKKVLIATVKELQDVKELRRTAKDYTECSYMVMDSMRVHTRKYIGIKKEELYSSAANPEQLVAIQGTAEKINKSAALLSIVNSYSAKQKIAKDEPEAVVEAKSVYKLVM